MSTLVQNAIDLKQLERQSQAFNITSQSSDDLLGKEQKSIISLIESTKNLTQQLLLNTQDVFSIVAALPSPINVVTKVTSIIDLLDLANVIILEVKNDLEAFSKLEFRHPPDTPALFLQKQKDALNAIYQKNGNIIADCRKIIEQLQAMLFSR